MNKASSRTLEITVLSGENLCVNQKPVTKNSFVTVWTESIHGCRTTRMAKEGGSYPSWNEKLMVDMPMHASSITFEVQCKTSMGVQSVGVARIAVSEFLGGVVPESFLQFLSYRLRDRKGRSNGIINFSVRVKTPEDLCSVPVPAKGMAASEKNFGGGVQMEVTVKDETNTNGVVTGVPVSWRPLYLK